MSSVRSACGAARAADDDHANDPELPRDHACADAFDPVVLYDEIRRAWPYRNLEWEQFERVVDFVATGGYALRAYERYAKLRQMPDGKFRIAHPGISDNLATEEQVSAALGR